MRLKYDIYEVKKKEEKNDVGTVVIKQARKNNKSFKTISVKLLLEEWGLNTVMNIKPWGWAVEKEGEKAATARAPKSLPSADHCVVSQVLSIMTDLIWFPARSAGRWTAKQRPISEVWTRQKEKVSYLSTSQSHQVRVNHGS